MVQLQLEQSMLRSLSGVNMVFNPAVPEIATVTSESLQLKIRQLLPSQDGFGTDLAAQNVIVPIIDLTPAAEGSDVPMQLQSALSFGGITEFNVAGTSTTIATISGFYRIVGSVTSKVSTAQNAVASITLTDGVTDKTAWAQELITSGTAGYGFNVYDLIIFLATGEECKIVSNDSATFMTGSVRQLAESNGTLVQPVGFTPQ